MDLQWIEQLPDYQFATDENIRKYLRISYALAEIGNGENYTVASLLQGEDFTSLSEDHKAEVFSHCHHRLTGITCLHKVTDHDIPAYLQQILPYMPLHKFQSCSLSPGRFTWLKSEEWMRDMLVKYKIRWNPDSNDRKNESVPLKPNASVDDDDAMLQNDEEVVLKNAILTDEDTIQKLRNLAFTMLAAELFYICCCRKAIQCCQYLLTIAPNLVDIYAGKDKTVALCTALMYDSSDVIDLLLEQQAPICSIGEAAGKVFAKSHSTRSFEFIRNILQCRENRDEVIFFQDQDGNTILHLLIPPLLYRNMLHVRLDKVTKYKLTQCIESCIHTILDYGADARKRNNNKETALDLLIKWYVMFIRIHNSKFTDIFLRNLQLILPSWGVALPSGFACNGKTIRDRVVMLFKIAELLLNDEHSLKFAIHSLQDVQLWSLCKPTDCQMCVPFVSLFHQAMCKGIDIHSTPGEFTRGFVALHHEIKDFVSYLLHVCFLPHFIQMYGNNRCCDRALLELLVHSGNDVFSHMNMIDIHTREVYPHVDLISDLLTKLVNEWFASKTEYYLDHINSIMSMLSMYAPSLLQRALPMILPDRQDQNEVKLMQETIAQIYQRFERVRPLQLLCRLFIRGNVAWKEVETLPLPPNLKHYVRIGDIPKSHVIHQIID